MSTRYYPLDEYLKIFEQQFIKFLNLTNLVNGYKDNIEEFFKQYSKHIYNVISANTYLFRTSYITDIKHEDDKLIIEIEFDITDVLRKVGPYEFAYKLDDNMIIQINKRSNFISVTDLKYIYEERIVLSPEIILRNGIVESAVVDSENFECILVSKGELLTHADITAAELVIYGYDSDSTRVKIDELLYSVSHVRRTQIPYIPLDKISENIETKTYGIPSVEVDVFAETILELIDTYIKQTNMKLNKFEYSEDFDFISCRFSDSEFEYKIMAFVEV